MISVAYVLHFYFCLFYLLLQFIICLSDASGLALVPLAGWSVPFPPHLVIITASIPSAIASCPDPSPSSHCSKTLGKPLTRLQLHLAPAYRHASFAVPLFPECGIGRKQWAGPIHTFALDSLDCRLPHARPCHVKVPLHRLSAVWRTRRVWSFLHPAMISLDSGIPSPL